MFAVFYCLFFFFIYFFVPTIYINKKKRLQKVIRPKVKTIAIVITITITPKAMEVWRRAAPLHGRKERKRCSRRDKAYIRR